MSEHPPALLLKLYYHGGIGVVRSLGRMGVPLHAIHHDAAAPAARSRHLREVVEWDLAAADPEASLELVCAIGRRLGGRPVLIAADDTAQAFVEANRDALAQRFAFPLGPRGLTERLFSKRGMHELCLEHDVPTPDTHFPQDRAEAREVLERSRFPVLLKPVDNVRFAARNGIRMHIVHDLDGALEAYDRLEDPEAPNLMVQDYLPGPSSSVWVFTGYFDADSELLFGAGGTKLRQYPMDTGTTCFGDVRSDPELEALVRRFAKEIGYRGVFDCGFRFDLHDGRYKLLDVNPRVGSNFRQCVGRGGLDVVRAMYLDLTGRPVPRDEPDEGRTWWVENYDVAAALQLRRAGRLPLRRWAASLRHVDEAAWFDPSDLRPFAAMIAGAVGATRRRAVAHLAPREPAGGSPTQAVLEHALDRGVERVETV